ncbi:hypothetical protein CBOM_07737 [Ceraceosorus bombacis]|uniref:Hydrophobin n=1 Tax=Ceraceosorus bombacis TaxID=401625 RepID=A0A0P1BHJ7_9BASI|nr:hypothetical protein CBOM_07737 [Ceraceosorus bombacis]
MALLFMSALAFPLDANALLTLPTQRAAPVIAVDLDFLIPTSCIVKPSRCPLLSAVQATNPLNVSLFCQQPRSVNLFDADKNSWERRAPTGGPPECDCPPNNQSCCHTDPPGPHFVRRQALNLLSEC